MFYIFVILFQFSGLVSANETVNGADLEDMLLRPRDDRPISDITAPAAIDKEVRYLRQLSRMNRLTEDFAYINKKNPCTGAFTTYIVNLNTGRLERQPFPSLIGYNGIGCGKGMTRPGVTRLTNVQGVGASRFPWWGNGFRYFDIEAIPKVSQCPINSQIVAHSNRRLSGKSVTDRVSSRSSGCLTMAPERLDEMGKYAGNALIYNVPPSEGTSEFCRR